MIVPWLLVGCFWHHVISASPVNLEDSQNDGSFTNQWAVEVDGGTRAARDLARDLGYEFGGKIGQLKNHYLFVKKDHPSRAKRSADHHTNALSLDRRVRWVEQQVAVQRVKRDLMPFEEIDAEYAERLTKGDSAENNIFKGEDKGKDKGKGKGNKGDDDDYLDLLNDPYWPQQWYLHDTKGCKNNSTKRLDLNVVPVWEQGITGKGVIVSVLDDGLEHTHPDLQANYEPSCAGDLNSKDPEDNDPEPRYYDKNNRSTDENKHGTRCAGEISMIANNEVCGVGVAPGSSITGVRMLDGPVTDKLEHDSLTWKLCPRADLCDRKCQNETGCAADCLDPSSDECHEDCEAKDKYVKCMSDCGPCKGGVAIYSSSWGPSDNGITVEGPGKLAGKALEQGVTLGREGKGVIYVWASGNGGSKGDDCDCDGYTASIYTVSISSVSEHLNQPWYGEKCASTMATTYSSGQFDECKIATVNIRNSCGTDFTGTSAAAPLASGIFALALEANPGLTWRDIQHLTAWTSQYTPLAHNTGWKKNTAGFWFNERFGFGLLDAEALVKAAKTFDESTIPEKTTCTIDATQTKKRTTSWVLNPESSVSIEVEVPKSCSIKHLEHVQVQMDIKHNSRGMLKIFLQSPNGTTSQILDRRSSDTSSDGFKKWPFMSAAHWGEQCHGTWIVTVMDTTEPDLSREVQATDGEVQNVTMIVHGTEQQPKHYATGPRWYDQYDMDLLNLREEQNSETAAQSLEKDIHELRGYLEQSTSDAPSPDEEMSPSGGENSNYGSPPGGGYRNYGDIQQEEPQDEFDFDLNSYMPKSSGYYMEEPNVDVSDAKVYEEDDSYMPQSRNYDLIDRDEERDMKNIFYEILQRRNEYPRYPAVYEYVERK